MPNDSFQFTTGPFTLPDIGTLEYNGCSFSPLFSTTISGNAVRDAANRTIRYVEYTLTADGYVTLTAGASSINQTMASLRLLLTAQGGSLVYKGRGCDIVVNQAGLAANSGATDVAWGPVPTVLEFQPLGGGLSAKVVWRVVVRIPEIKRVEGPRDISGLPLLQFNYDTSVSYDEAGYSTLSVRGIIEVAMTRRPDQKSRTLTLTVDDVRSILDTRIFSGIDLTRFRVTRRNYRVSRDMRTMDWEIEVEELPYMRLPPDCTMADGNFSFRPVATGAGLCNWLCTLRGSYTVRRGVTRRVAWFAFLTLLRERMRSSTLGSGTMAGLNNPPRPQPVPEWTAPPYNNQDPVAFWRAFVLAQARVIDPVRSRVRAWLVDFSGDEGMYRSSRVTSFSATWRLVSNFDTILEASGMWTKVRETDGQGNNPGNNLWAASVANISGSRSWERNRVDPSRAIIVDFGGG